LICGPDTGLAAPLNIAVDAAGYLYAANTGDSGSVTVYAPGATGDAKPTRTITSAALPDVPTGVAVDSAGQIYVSTGFASGSTTAGIFVFSSAADGLSSPVRTIMGSNTGLPGGNAGLQGPWSLAVDSSGYTYVVAQGVSALEVFAPGSNGNVAPSRVIAPGANSNLTSLSIPYGIAVDAGGHIFVADGGNTGIYEFSPTASGNAAPVRSITGTQSQLPGNGLYGVALDAQQDVYGLTGSFVAEYSP